jgi:peptidyl-prolyl cis-trans isomerase SurA
MGASNKEAHMRTLIGTIFTFLICTGVHARLLDKIIAVIDDQVVTLSEIKRIQNTIQERREILPQIYTKTKYSVREITKLKVDSIIIKKSLNKLGYIISDEEVENRIKQLGVPRQTLMAILSTKGFKYDDYFEMIRNSIEYIYFYQQVISPLISITDQEVKNEFFKSFVGDQTVAMKFKLVVFGLKKGLLTQKEIERFPEVMKQYKLTGILPDSYKTIETTDLGDVTEEGLTKDILKAVKSTEEGSFSLPVVSDDLVNVFFVSKKDLAETDIYQKAKPRIKARIFEGRARSIAENWILREKNKYYTNTFN